MYIENGIAYAGEQQSPMRICGVRAMEEHRLWVRFLNGEAKVFDFTPLLSTPAFSPLRDMDVFRTVYIDFGMPVWNDGDIDIDPQYLWDNSVPANS